MSDPVTLETDCRGVARLTLNRPEKHNALSPGICDALVTAAAQIDADPAVRVVVLAAAGPTFCAGGDLQWMREQIDASREARLGEARRFAMTLQTLNTLSRPLIACVHGPAYGGGLGLLAVCDSVVAAATARFAFTETRLGLIPATIAPYVLARMGEGRARSVLMSARVFDAAEAVSLGLVTRTAAPEALKAAVAAEVAPYLATAPAAVARAKRLARSLGPRIDAETIEASIAALTDTWETPEAAAGVAAFFARRPPPWNRS